MRITTEDFISNPELQRKFQGVKVLVNGVEHQNVIVADQEQGYIIKIPTDSQGRLITNDDADQLLQEYAHGKVEFIFKDSGQLKIMTPKQ